MTVSWEYILKRRNWNLKDIYEALDTKSYEEFSLFFTSRQVISPGREVFNKLVPTPLAKRPAPLVTPLVTQAKKKTKKSNSNDEKNNIPKLKAPEKE